MTEPLNGRNFTDIIIYNILHGRKPLDIIRTRRTLHPRIFQGGHTLKICASKCRERSLKIEKLLLQYGATGEERSQNDDDDNQNDDDTNQSDDDNSETDYSSESGETEDEGRNDDSKESGEVVI